MNITRKKLLELGGEHRRPDGHYRRTFQNKRTFLASRWENIQARCRTGTTNRFLNFQDFAEWAADSFIPGTQIDKDLGSLLLDVTPRYSRQTCLWLPGEVNTFFTRNQNHMRGVENRGSHFRVLFRGDRLPEKFSSFESASNYYWHLKLDHGLALAGQFPDIPRLAEGVRKMCHQRCLHESLRFAVQQNRS